MVRENFNFNPKPRNEDVRKENRGLEVRDYESQIQKLNEDINNYKKIIEELKSKVELNELTNVEELMVVGDMFPQRDRMLDFCNLFNVPVKTDRIYFEEENLLDSDDDFDDDYEYRYELNYELNDDSHPVFILDTSKLSKLLYNELKKIIGDDVQTREYINEN